MLNFATILDKVVSHAASLGVFDSVQAYESVSSPDNTVDCNIWLDTIFPIPGGLDQTSVCMVFNVSILASLLSEPYEETDKKMIVALDALMAAYNGDFTLGDTIRNVDILGQFTEGLRVTAEYARIDGTVYRAMSVSLPLLVDAVWEQNE